VLSFLAVRSHNRFCSEWHDLFWQRIRLRTSQKPRQWYCNEIVLSLFWYRSRHICLSVFTSHGLVCNLLQQNLTLIRTIMANRREVPSQLKWKKWQKRILSSN